MNLTIMEIVVRAGMHFTGGIIDRGEGSEIAQIRAAWDFLKDWNLRAEPHATSRLRNVLVVEDQQNARITATRSEILAFGIGVEVASRIYQIPYSQWEGSPGLSLHDIQAYDWQNSLVLVELRGRINRQHLRSAINEIYDKFEEGDFSKAAGIIVFPRTKNTSRTADIMIVDPLGKREPEGQSARFRILLRHYAPFFYYQGGVVRQFGERMRDLSYSDETTFRHYLTNGDPLLSLPTTKAGRVSFTWNETRYVGTIWEGVHWPKWLVGMEEPSEGGAFFWGLRRDVIKDIRSGNLERLADLNERPETFRLERRIVVVLPDGIALIWAPSKEELALAG
ncbi:MAG: hypothetical protein ACLPY1_18540 [Terracidiphilus sp.]